jgi:hypothetical protein
MVLMVLLVFIMIMLLPVLTERLLFILNAHVHLKTTASKNLVRKSFNVICHFFLLARSYFQA